MKIKILVLLVCSFAQGCSHIDDYMLGKDNTPVPKDLKPIESKIKVSTDWASPIGKSHKSSEYLKIKPVVLDNIIYTADPGASVVHAVNAHNGQNKWSTHLKNGVISGPTVAHGFVAVGTNGPALVLLNKADGKEVWHAKVSSELLSPPAIASKQVIAKTIDGKVFAFDLISGKKLWMVDHGSPSLVLKASSTPIIVNNLVLIGFSDGKLGAIELQSGRIVWERSISYATGTSDVERLVDIDADPIVNNNIVYLASYQGYIGALSLSDGQFLWRKPGSVYKNMLLNANTLYLTDSNDTIWSIDGRTGHVNWKQKSLKARNLTEPVLIGNELVVGDRSGYLHFIGLQTGEMIARSQLPGGISLSPSVVGRNLYVQTNNGMLNKLSVS
ncbi:MAG: outer membrane protein assembly factor BamB [bacterium]|nr:outer membrane protein assembly factor BamB [bacterium]